MATAKPVNIVHPQDLSQTSTSSTVSSRVIGNLDDNTKRHVTIGIALNNVLVPELKKYVDLRLSKLYKELVSKYSINTKQSKLKKPYLFGFNYKDHNDPNEYVITSHDELAKRYLKTYMTKFTKITDDSFDASAALTIMARASCFSKKEQELARQVTDKIRNPWAHCDNSAFSQTKFLESFKLIGDLVSSLCPPLPKLLDKSKLTQDLASWKVNGLKLIGKHVEPALLKKVFDEFQNTMEILGKQKTDLSAFESLRKQCDFAIKTVQEKQSSLDSEYITLRENVIDNTSRITNIESANKCIKKSSPMFSIPNRNSVFSGREEYLDKMKEALEKEGNSIVAIQGLGGVGKTTLALEAAWIHKDMFPGGVYWLTADSDKGDTIIKTSLFGLARKMDRINHNIEDERLVDVVTGHLMEQEKCLLVIDNLDSEELSSLAFKVVNGMWLRESNVSLIITSRLKDLSKKISLPSTTINLDCFVLEEGVDFLRKRTDLPLEQTDSQELVLELGGLPLALDQAAAFLSATKCKLPEYLKNLKEEKLIVLNKMKAHQPTEATEKARLAVQTTWRMIMDGIEKEFPAAQKLMHVLAFLSPRCIPKTIINEGSPKLEDEELAKVLTNAFNVSDLVHALTKLNLFEEDAGDCVRVHRMVQDIIKEEVKEMEIEEETMQNVQCMLVKALEVEETPSSFMKYVEEDIKWKVANLSGWTLIVENVGHFMQELKYKELTMKENPNSGAQLLDHASLYYYVLNQTERAMTYRQLMDNLLSQVNTKETEMYLPQFPIPFTPEKKEQLVQLLEPQMKIDAIQDGSHEMELRSLESKKEGDSYMKLQKFSQAVEAYNTALDFTASEGVRHKVSLNMCQSFYKLGQTDKCIMQAEAILHSRPNDPKAYLWLCLTYLENKKKHKENSSNTAQDISEIEELNEELGFTFGALALHFSKGDLSIRKVLGKKNLNLLKTKVIPVSSDEELCRAIIESGRNNTHIQGEALHIVLVQAGVYNFKEEVWQHMRRSLIVGDMSGTEPTFLIENYTAAMIAKNIFVNIHFKVKNGGIQINLFVESPLLFLRCKFESYSPSQNVEPISAKEASKLQEYQMQRINNREMAVEERELHERSVEELENDIKYSQTFHINGNGIPAVLVHIGQCAMIRCEISDCLGGGALVAKTEKRQDSEPLLYMKSCRIRNCQCAGAEAREHGNLILEDCDISANRQGVLVWMKASTVKIIGCNIYNNKWEGILGTEEYTYDNPTKLLVEGGSVHHNQIGLSLEYLKSVDVCNSKVFSNRTWGIFLRNSNVSTIQGNDIFRNDCGGIRVTLNRFEYTVVERNRIHDHTGPDICQTVFFSESLEVKNPSGLNRATNSIPVVLLNNLSYNNELAYGSVSEWEYSVDKCHFCKRPNPLVQCKKCRKVMYCNETCCKDDWLERHKTFCNYFTQTNMTHLSLQQMDNILPCNQLIPNRKKKMKLTDYRGKDFLVKISNGDNNFGQAKDENLLIYDEFRFISGIAQNKEVKNLVRQFGRLSGEAVFNKRIYLKARIVMKSKNELLVDRTELFHDLGW